MLRHQRLNAILARFPRHWPCCLMLSNDLSRHVASLECNSHWDINRAYADMAFWRRLTRTCAQISSFSNGEQDPSYGQHLSLPRLAAIILPPSAWMTSSPSPTDKISPAIAAGLLPAQPLQPCPHHPRTPELFDAADGENVYTRAARDLRAWREQGILTQEKGPCIFAYSQRFTVPGTDIVKERRGFIALGKVHDYSEKVVFRHEQTLSKPKGDRLNLLKATHAHFGQIFMLYSDPAGSVEKILYEGNGPADVEITDEYNVLHRLWKVADPAVIRSSPPPWPTKN